MKVFPRIGWWLLILLLITMLLVPFSFAGFWDWVTGRASDTTSLSVTITNVAPTIDSVNGTNTHPGVSITETTSTNLTFWFTASDIDGVSNLNDSSAKLNVSFSGEETRSNSTCTVADLNGTQANYTCIIRIWYWDGSGTWTVNASVYDINGALAQNITTTFALAETTGMLMSPTALTWTSLSLTDTNSLANENITINNTANKDIADGGVNVTGIDLQGTPITTDYIYAANFTVNISNNCLGASMSNDTSLNISGATIAAGNNSAGNGQEQLYFCLTAMDTGISAQTYNTAGQGEWTIEVI